MDRNYQLRVKRKSMAPVMKKKSVILFAIIAMALLSSCVGGRSVTTSEGQRADARMEQIISAIKVKDRETLKSLFSKKALKEADDFDGGIDYLFDFLQGDIKSWERDGWASSESIKHGKKSLLVRFAFNVHTDIDDYLLFVMDYSMDTIDPKNEGVYTLEITRLADEDTIQRSWQERLRAGIHKLE